MIEKKTLLLGTALTLPNPIIYALAPSWHLLILANFFGALGSALANPAYSGILYASVEQHERSHAIATLNTLSCLANLFVPPLGTCFIEAMGGLNEIRKMFVLQFFLSLVLWFYTFRMLKVKPIHQEKKVKGFVEVSKDIFLQMKTVYSLSKESILMAIFAAGGSFRVGACRSILDYLRC